MDATAAQLTREIEVWRGRLDAEVGKASPKTERGRRFLDNIVAYRADCDHFEREGDLVRAFECVVWAWAWLEIGAQTGDIAWTYPGDG